MRKVSVILGSATGALILSRLLHGWFPARVSGESMLPVLQPGDLVAVHARAGGPEAGDIVVVKRGAREDVKRVAAVHGDRIVVIGDNEAHSTDSRTYGPIPRSDVEGIVRAVYWPPRRARLLR